MLKDRIKVATLHFSSINSINVFEQKFKNLNKKQA